MNGLAELPAYSEGVASLYAEIVGRYSGMELRFSDQVSRPIPPTLTRLRKLLAAVYLPLAISDPGAADRKLALQWRPREPHGWILTIADTEQEFWASGFFKAEKHSASEGNWAAARRDLEPVLYLIERDWLSHRRALWLSLRTAEHVANQLLDVHLLRSEDRLAEVKADYMGDQGVIGSFFKDAGDIATQFAAIKNDRHKRARFDGLTAALRTLQARRKELELNSLERQGSVLRAAAIAASLVPVAVAAGASPDAPEAIEDLKALAGDAGGRARAAMLDYLAEMRRLAGEHPILIVIHQITAEDFGEFRVIRAVLEAVEQVGKAIAELTEVMQDPVVPPALRSRTGQEIAPGAKAMTDAIAESSKLGVWKLPLFIDTALGYLPEDERLSVTGLRTNALDQAEEELMTREMILTTLETATMFLPPARVAALVLLLGLGLARLIGALKAYDEATTLYHASMDPSFLALGDAGHRPADADMILLDLAGLVFDATGVGKALGR